MSEIKKVMKKVDRTLHNQDYQALKSELQKHHSSAKFIKQEIAQLTPLAKAYENSPQGADIQRQIKEKEQSLIDAERMVDHLQTLGRRGLKIDPDTYQRQQELKKMAGAAASGGFLAGAAGGASLMYHFNESSTSFKERYSGLLDG